MPRATHATWRTDTSPFAAGRQDVTEDNADPRARLIIRGLGGQHLWGFLPGRDNKEAVSAAVSSKRGWGVGPIHGQVGRDGIGEWPNSVAWRAAKPGNATLFVTWAELLEVVARGCADSYREQYEAAYAAWCAEIGPTDWSVPRCGYPSAEATRRLHEATAALIRHGCQCAVVQEALF